MARINIEEECFSRLSKLVDLLGCDAREALGTLAFLWHDSQDILKDHGTTEEISDWLRITKLPESEQTRWIKTLCKARFLTEVEPGFFLIHGNETQIENRLKHLEKSKKGAESTRRKWEEMRAKKKGHRQATGHATGIPQAGQCHATTTPNTIQGNAIQDNARQDNTRQSNVQSNPGGLSSQVEAFPNDLISLQSLWLERGVKPTQLDAMLLAFPDSAFIKGEALKAVAWEESNPARRKKDFARFLNNWLARAWDSRRVAPSRQSDGEAREAHNAMAAKAALKLMGVE